MTHCWLCGASEIKSPNSKYTYYGKILGKRVQKTIRVCNCCSAMRADEDIREEVAEIFGIERLNLLKWRYDIWDTLIFLKQNQKNN